MCRMSIGVHRPSSVRASICVSWVERARNLRAQGLIRNPHYHPLNSSSHSNIRRGRSTSISHHTHLSHNIPSIDINPFSFESFYQNHSPLASTSTANNSSIDNFFIPSLHSLPSLPSLPSNPPQLPSSRPPWLSSYCSTSFLLAGH